MDKTELLKKIEDHYRPYYKTLFKTSPKQVAEEYLSEKRVFEQLDLIEKSLNIPLENKKTLEVGVGYGISLLTAIKKYRMDAYGIEPSGKNFGDSYGICRELLKSNNISAKRISNCFGEKLNFENDFFDIVYSSNVLEHTIEPQKVLQESVRVLKPGGYLFFVVPNYGSIWEGHYGIFWIPYLPKFLSKIYVRILGRKSEYINSLQFITVPKLKKYLSTMNNIEVLGFGYDIWKNRVLNADVPQWANLKLLKTFLDFAKKFKLLNLIVFFGRIWYIQTPIVLTLRKKNVSA